MNIFYAPIRLCFVGNIILAKATHSAVEHCKFSTKTQQEKLCTKAVNEAEKLVGYPTSFLSLRWLLKDEVANIALNIKKIIGTNHPLLSTARELIMNKQTPTWGLIVLLVSKAGGLSEHFSSIDCDVTAGILHSQRVLSEVTEMIRMSNKIHNSILNLPDEATEYNRDLNFGNKLSLLTGDYLLSSSFRELALLKNHEVNELISTCLRDLVEAEFIEPRDKQNRPLPAKPITNNKSNINIPNEFGTASLKIKEALGNAKAEWTLRHFLGCASLLAKCCQGTLKLAEHSEDVQKYGYLFGRNMALAWQAHDDLNCFQKGKDDPFSFISAPVLFHLEHNPYYYEKLIEFAYSDKPDFSELRNKVENGPGLEKTQQLKKEFSQLALAALARFHESEAKDALRNIVESL